MRAGGQWDRRNRLMRLQGWWGVDYLPTGQFSGGSSRHVFFFMKTMKTSNCIITLPLIILAATITTNFSRAQTVASLLPAPNVGQPEPQMETYQISERDANSQIWQRVDYEPIPSGKTVPHLHKYIELSTGLNHMVSYGWPIGQGGSYTWPIHPLWRVGSESTTHSLSGWTDQVMTLSADGTMRVDKLGCYVTRPPN